MFSCKKWWLNRARNKNMKLSTSTATSWGLHGSHRAPRIFLMCRLVTFGKWWTTGISTGGVFGWGLAGSWKRRNLGIVRKELSSTFGKTVPPGVMFTIGSGYSIYIYILIKSSDNLSASQIEGPGPGSTWAVVPTIWLLTSTIQTEKIRYKLLNMLENIWAY